MPSSEKYEMTQPSHAGGGGGRVLTSDGLAAGSAALGEELAKAVGAVRLVIPEVGFFFLKIMSVGIPTYAGMKTGFWDVG